MKRFLTSCFGLGRIPFAPGTFGSLGAAVLFFYLQSYVENPVVVCVTFIILGLFFSAVTIAFTPEITEKIGFKDPGEIVSDEFAGLAVVYATITFFDFNPLLLALLGFVFFRIFDIWKPWLVHKVEKCPKGWGVLLDDVVAGVFALAVVLPALFYDAPGRVVVLFRQDAPLDAFSASILGIIQGLTEFLPVSSSGHLVLFEHLFGFDPERPQMLLFDLAAHVGTVIAIFIAFYEDIIYFFRNLYLSIFKAKYGSAPLQVYHRSPSVRFAVLGIFSTFVTALLGFSFEEMFMSARASLQTVAIAWLITATFLMITDKRTKTRIGLRQFGFMAAGIIGVAQAAAIVPGISRSGATICAGILLGLHRKWAVQYSFLLAIPAILGATLVTLAKEHSTLLEGGLSWQVITAGLVSSAIVGILAIRLLLLFSRKNQLKFFGIYCVLLSLFVFGYLAYRAGYWLN